MHAGRKRLRPILMTTFALIAGHAAGGHRRWARAASSTDRWRSPSSAARSPPPCSPCWSIPTLLRRSIEIASATQAIAKFHARTERWNAFAAFVLTLLEALATLLGLRLVWRVLRRLLALATGGRRAATPA
jgi:HAE1 family hydrophobic/amphiphilic exporter-1